SAQTLRNRVLLGEFTPRMRLPELIPEHSLQLHLRMDRLPAIASELRPGDGLVSIAHTSSGGVKDPRVRLEPGRHDLPHFDALARLPGGEPGFRRPFPFWD